MWGRQEKPKGQRAAFEIVVDTVALPAHEDTSLVRTWVDLHRAELLDA